MDCEFERRDAQCQPCGQRATAEENVAAQSAAPPFVQDWLRELLYALVYGPLFWCSRFYACGRAETGDGTDQMLGEGPHVPVGTRRGAVEVIITDRLGDMVQRIQCPFGTGEVVHDALPVRVKLTAKALFTQCIRRL